MEFAEPPRPMLVSDLDNTMVDHKDNHHPSLLRFGALWQADYNHDSLLVYLTRRLPTLYAKLQVEAPLLTPGVTVMSVGTEIMYGMAMTPNLGWDEELSRGGTATQLLKRPPNSTLNSSVCGVVDWPEMNIGCQEESEQRPYKVGLYVDKDVAGGVFKLLTQRFQERQLNAKLIYSGGVHLDVIPIGAGIGQALAYLMKKLKSEGRSPAKTLMCSNSGSDTELFTVPDVCGVIVGNAMRELLKWYSEYAGYKAHVYVAKERCTMAILEAMQHFDVQSNVSPRDRPWSFHTRGGVTRLKVSNVAHEVVDYHLLLEHWLKADGDNTDVVFSRLKSSLVRDGSYVHANGVITNPFSEVETLRKVHGVKKSTHYCIWVHQVRIEKLSDTIWIDAVNGLQWKLVHETWLPRREGSRSPLQAPKPEECPKTQRQTPESETESVQEPSQDDAPVPIVEKTPESPRFRTSRNVEMQQNEAINAEAPVEKAFRKTGGP